MAFFIEIHTAHKNPRTLLLNADHVRSIEKNDSRVQLQLVDGEMMEVRETYDELKHYLSAAHNLAASLEVQSQV